MDLIYSLAIYLIFLFTCLKPVIGCSFPGALRGTWISAERGTLQFNESWISNYVSTMPGEVPPLDLFCVTNEGTQYFLKAAQYTEIFGEATYYYICLDIQPVDDKFVYYIATNYSTTLQENIYGSSLPTDLSMACHSQRPYNVKTFISLVKQDTLPSITCPNDILAVFQSLSIQSTLCTEASLDVCTNTTQLRFSGSACGGNAPLSGALSSCLYFTTSGGETYLSTLYDNGATFEFFCIAFSKIGNSIYASENPGICSEDITPTNSAANGQLLVIGNINITCAPAVVSIASTIAESVSQASTTNMMYLLFLFLILVFIIIFLLLLCYLRKCGVFKNCKQPKGDDNKKSPEKPRLESPVVEADSEKEIKEKNGRPFFTSMEEIRRKTSASSQKHRVKFLMSSNTVKITPALFLATQNTFVSPVDKITPMYEKENSFGDPNSDTESGFSGSMNIPPKRPESDLSVYSLDDIESTDKDTTSSISSSSDSQ